MNLRIFSGLIGVGLLCSSCATSSNQDLSRLDLIQKRDQLRCGVSGKIPGFSYLNKGVYEGLDVDICKAMAAAFLGDSSKVIYRPLTATERFTALRTGEIDILSRNTTLNLSRDSIGGNGVTFGPVIFHDGQGLMVKKKSKINKLEDLNNQTICVGSGTTTEQNLNDVLEEKGIKYLPIKYQDLDQVVAGYLQGRCKAITSDRSQLAAAKSGFKNKKNHLILDFVMSKEPLAPATIGGDQKLSDAVRWVIYALFTAEEYGINKSNINSKVKLAKENKNMSYLRRILGINSGLGVKLGLDDDFIVKVIRSTGNYGEIYDRNLGTNSGLAIKRGLNKNYKDGGLLISPPLK